MATTITAVIEGWETNHAARRSLIVHYRRVTTPADRPATAKSLPGVDLGLDRFIFGETEVELTFNGRGQIIGIEFPADQSPMAAVVDVEPGQPILIRVDGQVVASLAPDTRYGGSRPTWVARRTEVREPSRYGIPSTDTLSSIPSAGGLTVDSASADDVLAALGYRHSPVEKG